MQLSLPANLQWQNAHRGRQKVLDVIPFIYSCSPTSTNWSTALPNLRWSINKFQIENRTSQILVMVIGSAYLSIPKFENISPPGCVTIKCGLINKIQRRSPISFGQVALWFLSLILP